MGRQGVQIEVCSGALVHTPHAAVVRAAGPCAARGGRACTGLVRRARGWLAPALCVWETRHSPRELALCLRSVSWAGARALPSRWVKRPSRGCGGTASCLPCIKSGGRARGGDRTRPLERSSVCLGAGAGVAGRGVCSRRARLSGPCCCHGLRCAVAQCRLFVSGARRVAHRVRIGGRRLCSSF